MRNVYTDTKSFLFGKLSCVQGDIKDTFKAILGKRKIVINIMSFTLINRNHIQEVQVSVQVAIILSTFPHILLYIYKYLIQQGRSIIFFLYTFFS